MVYEDRIPMNQKTIQTAKDFNIVPSIAALNGGEDYELLFTVPIGDLDKVKEIEGIRLIGHITEEKYGKILVTRDNQEFELKAQGWNPLN